MDLFTKLIATSSLFAIQDCASDPPAAGAVDPAPPAAAAPERRAAAEDLTQAELAAMAVQIVEDVERIRGRRFERAVPVRIATRADFLDHAEAEMAAVAPSERLAHEEAVGKLLGMLPPGLDLAGTTREVMFEDVNGFYDAAGGTFSLTPGVTGNLARVTMVHELTHALDHQVHDLDERLRDLEGNSDARLALRAVIEGSSYGATWEWIREKMRAKQLSPRDVTEMPGMESEALKKAPESIWKPLLATIMRGSSFLVRSNQPLDAENRSADPEDIARAFADPPRSTEQILHQEKYWDEEKRDEPRAIAFHTGGMPAGWEVLHEDTLGELGMALFTNPPKKRRGIDLAHPFATLGLRMTNRAATGWGGDRYLLLGKGIARLLVSVSVWDTAKDGVEFHQAAESLHGHILESNLDYLLEISGGDCVGGRTGCVVTCCEQNDEVVITSWVGVTEDERREVLEAISWSEVD